MHAPSREDKPTHPQAPWLCHDSCRLLSVIWYIKQHLSASCSALMVVFHGSLAAAAKSRAAAAAAVAAASVTPGQRDRAIQQAALAALKAREAAAAAASGEEGNPAEPTAADAGSDDQQQPVDKAAPRVPAGNAEAAAAPAGYEPPEWSGVPDG